MKRVLLVDDDPILLRIYQQGLKKHDLHVETATDGSAAMTSLRISRPDIVILDLMMPRFNGVEVLRFIRSNAELASLPVVMLSNAFIDELGREAVALGAQKILPKVKSSPSKLAGIIHDILALAGDLADERDSAGELAAESDFKAKARQDLIENAPGTCALLRNSCRAITSAKTEAERGLRIEEFYHKVHFLSAAASLAESYFLAQMASAFEALLFELVTKPSFFSPSVMRTIVSTVDFLVLLLNRVQEPLSSIRVYGQTLVVDDDPLSTRLIQAALARAGLDARCTQDPLEALQWLERQPFALILLDIEMPNMDGFELGRRVRGLSGYQKTPIIFVTSHGDFETRAKSLFHGGDDLIAKPVFPLELAVKAVAQLLRQLLPESST